MRPGVDEAAEDAKVDDDDESVNGENMPVVHGAEVEEGVPGHWESSELA